MSNKQKNLKKINKINDIEFLEEKKDVDISNIFTLSKVGVYSKIFKQNTLDISLKLKKYVNLSLYPKIKLLKLKRQLTDLKKTKKNKDLNLKNYKPKVDRYSLNLINIEEINRQAGPYVDIFFQKPNLLQKFFLIFKKIKIKNIYQLLFFLVFLIIFFFGYIKFINIKINSSFKKLEQITLTSDFDLLKKDLVSLKTDFIILDSLLKGPFIFNNLILKNQNISNLENIIYGTKNIIDFGLDLIVVNDGIKKVLQQKSINEIMYSQLLTNIYPILKNSNEKLNTSIKYFLKINDLGNHELNNKFFTKLELLKKIQTYFNIFYQNQDVIKSILADEKKKTYLIVFQNNDEIRPTGGFMGSVGFLDIFKGKVLNFEKKDIYAIEWNIKDFSDGSGIAFKQLAPEGINKISTTFGLRDANYFLSIKESSEKIKDFLKLAGYNIDGIIYINQNVILDFLDNFGGIYFDYVKKEINSSNFSFIISTLVESKVFKTHTLSTPKQVLFDFIELFFEKIKNDKDYISYLKLILNSIEKRDIIFWSFYENENNFIKDIGFYNDFDFNYFDFNYPVFTSISGNKSDRYIQRSFIKNIYLQENCDIKTSLKIIQKHTFNITEEIKIKNFLYDMNLLGVVDIDKILKVQGKGLNKQYIRVLLPKNSIITPKMGIKIRDLDNYKEVSFYLDTNTFFSSEFEIEYLIINNECKDYEYNFIKQPGIKNYSLDIYKNGNLIKNIYTDRDYLFR